MGRRRRRVRSGRAGLEAPHPWYHLVFRHDAIGGGGGAVAALPVVPARPAGAIGAGATTRVLLTTMPSMGLGGPPASVGAAPQRRGAGDRPSRTRRTAR